MAKFSHRSGAPHLRTFSHYRPSWRKGTPYHLRKHARVIGIALSDPAPLPPPSPNGGLAVLTPRGRTKVSSAIEMLQDVCGRALVAGTPVAGHAHVPGSREHCAIGRIASALEHCQGAACLVLSCDFPATDERLLRALLAERKTRPPGTHVTAFRLESKIFEPLMAIYEPESLPYFQIGLRDRRIPLANIIPPYQQHIVHYAG